MLACCCFSTPSSGRSQNLVNTSITSSLSLSLSSSSSKRLREINRIFKLHREEKRIMEGGSIYSSSSSSILTNYALISSLLAFLLAQSAKFIISGYKEKRWDVKRLFGSGGMPSSHSATVTALAAATGFHDGCAGSLFAATMVLACVVMYDARGVRLHAGRQAEVLNQIVYELPAEHPLADTIPLRELLGHTFPQVVAGGILGIATAVIVHLIKIVIAKA